MHRLAHISIRNFKSCNDVSLPLGDFTPLVGYNNAGKSNILTAIEWLITPTALTDADFWDASKPIIIEGVVEGITDEIVEKMPDNQIDPVKPYLKGSKLVFKRQLTGSGSASKAKLTIRNPEVVDESDEDAWSPPPTGFPNTLKTLFPEPIRIKAMQDAADDVGKQTRSNTIGKLIADVIEPVREAHDEELKKALEGIGEKFSADSSQRAEQLEEFDSASTGILSELFPGLQLKLDVPLPEIPDLFKNGTVRVLEPNGSKKSKRTFSEVGHGAQRCIQMALIRYLAEKKGTSNVAKRKLLLIDEPELYLHPQGVEQVRCALRDLSTGSYQVVFSTHSPVMLHRDHAPNAITVRKPDPTRGTLANKPLTQAVESAIDDNGHAARVLFELGNVAEIFFSDRVLLNEGKTERAILPLVYESYYGCTPQAKRTGMVSMHGSGNFHSAREALSSMQVDSKILADLDYAFRHANRITGEDPPMGDVEPILERLSEEKGFKLKDGLPRRGDGWTAAKAWSCFAADDEGSEIAEQQHQKLREHGIWIWTKGTIEDVLDIAEKGEDAIQDVERNISGMSRDDLIENHSEIADFLEWLHS